MTTLDWIFIAVLLGSMLLGAWRGLVYEVLSLLGWVVAFMVARTWAQEVAVWLPLDGWDMQLRYAAGFVLLLVGAMFAWGVMLLLVLALVIQYTPLHKAQWWLDSALSPWLSAALGWVLPTLPPEWGQYLPGVAS